MKAAELHKHEYKDIGIARITRIDNNAYPGSAGDKSFLMHVCKCKDKKAFEYGATDKMKLLLEELRG